MIRKFIKYIYLRIKWRNKLSFHYTSKISKNSIFEGMNKLYPYSSFNGYMGKGSYIGEHTKISGKIGRFTSIASKCNVIQGVHPYTYPFVSTSPMFISTKKQNGYTFVSEQKMQEQKFAFNNYPIVIGNDCWIGENVNIIAGTTINDGAVVLAGAFVTKDIPPYAIVGGVPAKIIKYRYSEEDINYLMKLQWWNKNINWIENHSELFINFNEFKNNVTTNKTNN